MMLHGHLSKSYFLNTQKKTCKISHMSNSLAYFMSGFFFQIPPASGKFSKKAFIKLEFYWKTT